MIELIIILFMVLSAIGLLSLVFNIVCIYCLQNDISELDMPEENVMIIEDKLGKQALYSFVVFLIFLLIAIMIAIFK